MKKLIVLFATAVLLVSCSKNPAIDSETMLDGEKIFDPSLYTPEKYLVSAANPHPTEADLQTPVIIAAHGYSATTFEWDELRAWSREHGGFLLSQVLLGGHGRTYQEFKRSTWRDWQTPILEEYQKLEQLGYRKISLLGSSTGCALMLELAASRAFDGRQTPRHFIFIDPIVIPSDKLLSLVDFVGPMLGYTETSPTPEEEGKWYHYRPYETLQELNQV
ncbi:MAG: esterase, partial [candidate division KSB1 bacterium]|nr:esterase [candidate division KSB1 bacterium]